MDELDDDEYVLLQRVLEAGALPDLGTLSLRVRRGLERLSELGYLKWCAGQEGHGPCYVVTLQGASFIMGR